MEVFTSSVNLPNEISAMKLNNRYLLHALLALLFCCGESGDKSLPATPTIVDFNPKSGTEGTTVTIDGINFSNMNSENQVAFNGTVAEVDMASNTQLVVTMPHNSVSGNISVNVNGQTAISSDIFEVLIDSWVPLGDYPGNGLIRATGFSIENKGYIVFGFSTASQTRELDLWEYDPNTNQWAQKRNFPAAGREYSISFTIGTKAYVGLGYSGGQDEKDLWEYSQVNDEWVQKADFPGDPREAATAFTAQGKGYVGLGTDLFFNAVYKDFWEYDPVNDKWTQKSSYPGQSNNGVVSFSINGVGYVGLGGAPGTGSHKEFWAFDPTSNQWSQITDFPGEGRSYGIAFSLKGKGYAGLGRTDQEMNDFWQYNPTSDQWTPQQDFSGTLRNDIATFTIEERAFIGTGNPGGLKEFWEFMPQ